ADPFIRQHIGPSTDRIEQRLQACYPPHLSLQDAGGCVTRKQLDFVVYPFVTSQATDGNLPAEALAGKSTSDVGLLRVQTNGVPTVRLAPALPTDYALDVLGFVGTPGPVSSVPDPKNLNPHGEHDIAQHFAPIGGPILKSVALKPDEAAGSAMLKQQLGKGIEGGPVVDGGKDAASGGQVIGLIPAPAPPGQPVPTLVGATTILSVLKNAGVTNQSSLASAQFEAAMHHFKNQEYAASIPYFVNSLKQFRGQALATADLAKARDEVTAGRGSPKVNTATSTTGPPGSGGSGGSGGSSRTILLTIGLVAAALVALVVLGLALRARRREAGKDVTTPSGGSTPTPVPVGGGPRHGSQPSPGGAPGAARVPMAHVPRDGAPAAPSTRSAAPRTAERPGLPHRGSSSPPPPPNQPSRRRPSPAQPSTNQPSTNQPSTIDRSTDNNPSPVPHLMAEAQPAGTAPSSHWTAFCTSCGARLSERHRFCGLCGAPVGQ
ncbi:MAG TPA: hypothetical protein VGN19_01055, partial [Pedococcus sp.]|nr:hypothetical protein [Pedococcus sp.]